MATRFTPQGEKMEPLSIYLPSDLKARIEQVAKSNKRSTSAEAALRLEQSLTAEEEAKTE